MDTVVADLLACLDDPALALLQWTEAFNVVQARSHPDQHGLRSRDQPEGLVVPPQTGLTLAAML